MESIGDIYHSLFDDDDSGDDGLFGKGWQERFERQQERRRAAKLKLFQAQAAKIGYPVMVCEECQEPVAWLGDPYHQPDSVEPFKPTTCFDCLTRDGHSSWGELMLDDPSINYWHSLSWGERRRLKKECAALSDHRPALWKRLLRPLHRRPFDIEAAHNWRRFVNDWAPIEEWQLVDGAEKVEIDAPDGSGRLILFLTGDYSFSGGRWQRLPRQRTRSCSDLCPTVFSASLPIDWLAAAWLNFQQAVAADNERHMRREEKQRERDRQQGQLSAQEKELADEQRRQGKGTVDLF